MRLRKLLLLPFLVLCACLAAQYAQGATLEEQIDVFGVRLFSPTDHKEINGVRATEEPCLKGYERHFEALDIVIGYGFNKKVRKITTLNPKTMMFGVRPGTPFEEGKRKVVAGGLTELRPPYAFRADGVSLTLLVNDKDEIFGLTVEALD